ncbi:MAG: hypothetical protein RLZZ370_1885 [Bacteroidota bacterium]|jgi:hypothetical protein
MNKQQKKDLLLGMIGGISLPFVIALLIFTVFREEGSQADFIDLLGNGVLMSPFIRMGLIGNGVMFWLFLRRNRDMVCRGILLSTMIYGVYVVAMVFKS